jgi:hypothetical protein
MKPVMHFMAVEERPHKQQIGHSLGVHLLTSVDLKSESHHAHPQFILGTSGLKPMLSIAMLNHSS